MPLYDYGCAACGQTFETMAAVEEESLPCPLCGGRAGRLVSVGRAYRADAPWIESVTAVAEKGTDRPHVRAFLASPDRRTYRDWLRSEGIRPLEPGETRSAAPDTAPLRREVLERFKARHGLV